MNRPDLSMRKAQLRQATRKRRRAIGDHQRTAFDRAIQRHLARQLDLTRPTRIAAYIAFDGEPNLRPTLDALPARGTEVALPVLEDGGMQMRCWSPEVPMQNNAFNIPEPVATARIELRQIDILLLPLVAYDPAGNRLGMGGGYYDRLLREVAGAQTPLRVGVAYAAQEVASLPVESWDVPLHAIVNEHGWFSFDG
jgi:5-formyltetrahydrofolate cyclo-ligase